MARIVVPEGNTAVSYGSGTLVDVRDQFGVWSNLGAFGPSGDFGMITRNEVFGTPFLATGFSPGGAFLSSTVAMGAAFLGVGMGKGMLLKRSVLRADGEPGDDRERRRHEDRCAAESGHGATLAARLQAVNRRRPSHAYRNASPGVHARFAEWLAERTGEELVEIRAYHLDPVQPERGKRDVALMLEGGDAHEAVVVQVVRRRPLLRVEFDLDETIGHTLLRQRELLLQDGDPPMQALYLVVHTTPFVQTNP